MKLIYVLLTTFALGVTPAFGNPSPPQAQNIPKCELVQTKDGREMCAYDLDDWVSVLKADALITHQGIMLGKLEEKVELLEEQKTDLQLQIKSLAANERLLIQHNNKLTQDLIDLDKKYQDERVKPRLGNPLAWTIAATSAAILLGYVTKDAID